jgi:hypothetical protein
MSMSESEFQVAAHEHQAIRPLLDNVAASVRAAHPDIDTPGRYAITGAEVLLAMATYALYRLVKDRLDHHRALGEIELARKQAEIVVGLVDAGFPPELAQATTTALLENVRGKTADDPAIKAALVLIAGDEGGA